MSIPILPVAGQIHDSGSRSFGSGRAESAAAGAAGDSPSVAGVGAMVVDESKAKVSASLLVLDLVAVADFDVVVLPSGKFVGLALRQPPSTAVVVKRGSDKTTGHQIDGIVVAQVHGCPPNPAGVSCKEELELREAVAHEQGLENGVGSVERGESTKW